MSRILPPLLALSMVALQGCYTHRPATVEGLQSGSRVRASVSTGEAQRLEEVLGARSAEFQGIFLGRESGGLVFQVPTQTGLDGRPIAQRVLVPESGVDAIELRQLDRGRTAALVAGATLLGGLLAINQFAAARSPTPNPDPGPVNEIAIPLLRLRLGR